MDVNHEIETNHAWNFCNEYILFSFLKFDNMWCHPELFKMQFSYVIEIKLLLLNLLPVFIPHV